MDVVFEFVIQFIVELLGEGLFNAGWHGPARVLRSRVGRVVLAAGAGIAAGFWWGAHVSSKGRVQEPRTLWISLALGAVAGLAALWRWLRGGLVGKQSALSPPWRWSASRLVGFAILNAAVALGVALGFHPHPLR